MFLLAEIVLLIIKIYFGMSMIILLQRDDVVTWVYAIQSFFYDLFYQPFSRRDAKIDGPMSKMA